MLKSGFECSNRKLVAYNKINTRCASKSSLSSFNNKDSIEVPSKMQVRRETPFHQANLASGNLGVFVSVCLFESLLLVLGLPATVNLRTILVGPGLPFTFFCLVFTLRL